MIRYCSLIVFLLLLVPFSVWAQNSLWIDTVSACPQRQVHLSLNISNTDTIVAFQCDVNLPSQLTYVANSAQLTLRANNLALAATLIAPATLRVIGYSLSGAAIQGNSGTVLTFDCMSKTLPGIYLIHPDNGILSNPAQQNVLTNAGDGQFVLLAPLIQTSADSINFGSIPLGQSSNVTITINNVGNMPLSLQGISSTLAEIIATDSSSATIDPNSSITRTLQFQPVKKGTKIGVLSLKSNDAQDSLKLIKVRGIAYAVNEIHVGATIARSGYQTKLRLSVNNMESFNALQCVLHLPSVMKYVGGSAVLLSRKVDQTISADTVGSALNIVCFSLSNSAFQGNNGDILELTFLIIGQGGTYPIPIDGGILADSTGANVISASYTGSLQIASPKLQLSPQQLNFGSVSSIGQGTQSFSIQNTGSDTLVLTSMTVVGDGFTMNQSLPLVLAPNQSSSVQVMFSSPKEGSHTGNITMRSNDVSNDPAVVNLSGSIFIPTVLSVEQDSIYENRSGLIRIGLWNLKSVTAVQFDLTIPSGLVPSIDSVQKTSRETDHILQATSLGSNIYRFILYSPTSTVLKDTIGDIMKLPIYASGSSGSYSVQLQNVSISDTSGHNISTSQQNGTMKIINIGLPLLSQSFVNFGNVRKDDSLTQRITFYNQNLTNIFLKPISFSLSQGFNLVQTGDSSVLQQGDSASFGIKFKPASFGTFTDTATVVSDGGTVKIAVIGTSPIPTLTNLKTSIAYGNVAKNTTKTDTVKVVNSSINTLIVDSIYTKTSAFTVSKSNGTAGTDTLKVIVSFTPTTVASYMDTVYLHNNSATTLVTVPLNGTGYGTPIYAVSRTSINLGNVILNTQKTDTITIWNKGTDTLKITGITSSNGQYSATPTVKNIAPNGSLVDTIKFMPTAIGSSSTKLLVVSNDASSPDTIAVSGTSPIPTLTNLKTSIAYGNVSKNTTKTDTIKIINSSINTLIVDSIYTKTSAFTVSKSNGTAGSDTLKVIVSFTPTTIASYADTVYLHNNSATALVKVPLSGISPKPIILCNPRIIAFDDVGIYDSSKTILKIANSSISILIIDSIYTHSAAFTASSSFCQATNKDTAMITIFFKPVKFGSFIDTLCLRNNSDTALFKIPLSGNTPNSSISITPSSIVFGTAKKDSTKQLLFTITNPSISVLQIDSFWTQTKYFNVTHMLARGQVRIGDSTKVTIRFTPDSSRSYVDTMFIANNSPVSPFKVPLSGNGTLTGVKNNQSGIPTVFSLSQNYPNPFNPSTTIQYGLPARSIVRIVIYNILGQAVKELINSEQQAGYQSIVWNAKVASGMYFYRIVATSLDNTNKRFIETKKMLFLK